LTENDFIPSIGAYAVALGLILSPAAGIGLIENGKIKRIEVYGNSQTDWRLFYRKRDKD